MILLTGGTGFVGRHIITQFVADTRHVRVLTRTPGRAAFPDTVSWSEGDLANPESLRVAMRGIEVVIHAAAVLPGGPTSDERLTHANAEGTGALARAAREAGVQRFIHIGSAGVYGDGPTEVPHRETDIPQAGTPYERSKLAAERALQSALEGSDVAWTILRAAGLYGADRPATVAFFQEVARKRVWIHGPARVIIHPTHVSDLVGAVRLVMDREILNREVLNVGGERPLEFRELIALIGEKIGHGPPQFSMPGWFGRIVGPIASHWPGGKPPVVVERISRRILNRAVSIERARSLLGFAPVALDWGLDQTAKDLHRLGKL